MHALGVGLLVAAPDKFRGTASAAAVARAAAAGARRAGWQVREVPMSDGGEGLLEAVGGTLHRVAVAGPMGSGHVEAAVSLLDDPESTAVVEMAQAAGLALAGGPEANDPERATTLGVGQLVMAAVELGARRVVIGCGGSASTDGGSGALAALETDRLAEVALIAACDTTATFVEAATVFGPQKGATPEQVHRLEGRLERLAGEYRRRLGVDVSTMPGSGAAGGLAGGLAAVGAQLVGGFDLVASLVGLPERLEGADAVMTGEGCLDETSFTGKVVGGVLDAKPEAVAGILVVGEARPAAATEARRRGVRLRSLVEVAGALRARREVLSLVSDEVAQALATTPTRHPDP